MEGDEAGLGGEARSEEDGEASHRPERQADAEGGGRHHLAAEQHHQPARRQQQKARADDYQQKIGLLAEIECEVHKDVIEQHQPAQADDERLRPGQRRLPEVKKIEQRQKDSCHSRARKRSSGSLRGRFG